MDAFCSQSVLSNHISGVLGCLSGRNARAPYRKPKPLTFIRTLLTKMMATEVLTLPSHARLSAASWLAAHGALLTDAYTSLSHY